MDGHISHELQDMWETVTTTFKISFATYRRLSTSYPHPRPHDDYEMNKLSEPGRELNYKIRIS